MGGTPDLQDTSGFAKKKNRTSWVIEFNGTLFEIFGVWFPPLFKNIAKTWSQYMAMPLVGKLPLRCSSISFSRLSGWTTESPIGESIVRVPIHSDIYILR